jgi:hypothetical protein
MRRFKTKIRKTATLDEIMALGPCMEREEVAEFFGTRKRLNLDDLVAIPFPKLSYANKLWVLLHEEFIPEKELHLLACRYAERALRREREAGREPDARSWEVLRVKRRWVAGRATDEELEAAEAEAAWAARTAAAEAWAAWREEAAWAAARAAAWAAWRAAAWAAWRAEAARAAARAAAWAAWREEESKWQYHAALRVIRRVYRELGK